MLTHHAYYIEGPTTNYDAYHALFKPLYGQKYDRFGIDEARRLIEIASLKNYTDSVFLIVAPSMTTEAQQALLKLFEEPQAGTTFVLVVPPGVLLPTLRSRMLPYVGSEKFLRSVVTSTKSEEDVSRFLHSTPKERSDLIAKLLKDDEGARERVREFVDALEVALHEKIASTDARFGLRDVAMVRGYLRDRSPSLKMLLEHLAVSLPVV